MDFKNTIILKNEKNTKFLCQKDWILNVFEVRERDYSLTDHIEKDVTYIALYFENYKNLAMKDGPYIHPDANGIVNIKLSEDFKIVTGRLRGDKATEVLFGEKT